MKTEEEVKQKLEEMRKIDRPDGKEMRAGYKLALRWVLQE